MHFLFYSFLILKILHLAFADHMKLQRHSILPTKALDRSPTQNMRLVGVLGFIELEARNNRELGYFCSISYYFWPSSSNFQSPVENMVFYGTVQNDKNGPM